MCAGGTTWTNAIHTDDREKVASDWYEAAKTDGLFESEYRYVDSDGAANWCFVRSVPELDEMGNIIGYVGSLTDINERKHAEEGIKKSESELREILENSPVGVSIKTRNSDGTHIAGERLLVNSSLLRLFGATDRETFIKTPIDDS